MDKKMKIFKTRNDILEILPKNLIIAELGVFNGDFSEQIKNIIKTKKIYFINFESKIISLQKSSFNFKFFRT